MVPRLTAAELQAKDGAYLAAQNGALVFVESGTGGTAKTANVTGTGFYYYDAPNSVWVGVGGGGTFENPDVTNNGRLVETITAPITDYSSNNETFFELSTSGGPGSLTITLPNPADNVGRIIVVMNNGPKAIDVSNAFNFGLQIISNRSTFYVSNGTTWVQSSR